VPVGVVRIRPGREADLAALGAVEVAAGQVFRTIGLDAVADDDPPAPDSLRPHVASGTLWVAELEGAVVGYAVASVVDDEGHLDQVSVHPEAGRAGIGTALVEQVCAWAAQRGLPAVTLTTYRDPAWNGPFYARLGFEAMPDDAVPPGLAAIRVAEATRGLDVIPRIAMRRQLSGIARTRNSRLQSSSTRPSIENCQT
jgi:GNAT superfamily N-acetyltransferase